MSEFKCLAIETATNESSVAACNGDRIEILHLQDSRSASRELYQSVAVVLEQAELEMADLDCVAFGCGPGSFTGVRVAAGAAQAIAFAQDITVCRVSSLAAMAAAVHKHHGWTPVAACLDARMNEAYLGIYDLDAGGMPQVILADQLVQPADFCFDTDAGKLLLAGNGWHAYPELVENNRDFIAACEYDIWPDAMAVIAIARMQFAAGKFVQPFEALPNYVRNQVTHQA
jgi:tRNA threonylcarbamoyladenosine biosynthesis protein TsaB